MKRRILKKILKRLDPKWSGRRLREMEPIRDTTRYSFWDVQQALNLAEGIHENEDEIREGMKTRTKAKHPGR